MRLWLVSTIAVTVGIACAAAAGPAQLPVNAPGAAPPPTLAATGFESPTVAQLAFTPQYPLWSDGTRKRRWIALPPGTAIGATDPDAWQFPVGTRLWKEFAYDRKVETRYVERLADGSWRFATYVWNDAGTEATLAPADGDELPVAGAPRGRYAIPSRNDCTACHEGPSVPVLGFSALQLSPDRDPLAPHAERKRAGDVDLPELVARGIVRNLPPALLATPPRIDAPTPTARAALGYLHGNCGHCHNDAGALTGLELVLAQQADAAARSSARTLASLVGYSSRFRPHGAEAQRIASVAGADNVLTLRMQTPNLLARMPPLGVQLPDAAGIALIERWIANDLRRSTQPQGDPR